MTDIAKIPASASQADVDSNEPTIYPDPEIPNLGLRPEKVVDIETKRRAKSKKATSPSGADDDGKKEKGPSIELLYSRHLCGNPEFTSYGSQTGGRDGQNLYRWDQDHWRYVADSRRQALEWIEIHAQNRYAPKLADSCVDAVLSRMNPEESILAMESRRQKRVIVPLKGKYLELVSGQLRVIPADPALGMTFAVPTCVDPDKCCDDIYTPGEVPPDSVFGRYLARFIPTPADQDKLAEIVAASLVPGGVERVFAFIGDGGNGKSTVLHLLEALHPNTNTVIHLRKLGSTFGMADLLGKTLAIDWECPDFVGSEAEQSLKSLVSRDSVQIERKHKNPISILPRTTVYLAANDVPKFVDHTRGMERKIEYFAFNHGISEKEVDLNYYCKITESPEEMVIALDWVLAGLVRLADRKFRMADRTESQTVLREAVKLETDTVYAYMMREMVVLPVTTAPIVQQWYETKKAVYAAYRDQSVEAGEKPVAETSFWKRLRRRMEERGTPLEVIRGKGSERLRVVNIAVDPEKSEQARAWLEEQRINREILAKGEVKPLTADQIPF